MATVFVGRRQRHRNTGSVWAVESVSVDGQLLIRCEDGGRGEAVGKRIAVWPDYFLDDSNWELLNL